MAQSPESAQAPIEHASLSTIFEKMEEGTYIFDVRKVFWWSASKDIKLLTP